MLTQTRRLALAVFLAFSFGAPGVASDLADALRDMSAEDRALFDSEVRRYLLENPEIIQEAVNLLEERRRAVAALADAELVSQHKAELLSDGFSYVGGNPDGDVTVVEFSDYRCSYCKRAHPQIMELLERDPNVRLVVKEFPILGPDSMAASRMALAALEIDPSRYGELNDALMGFQGNLTEAMAYRIAGQLDYDIADLKERAQSQAIEDKVARNYGLAKVLGLEGTPSFVIGSQVIRGYIDIEDMLASVAQARAATN